MRRFFISLTALAAGVGLSPASAADLSALCKGYAGKWHQLADATLRTDGSWTEDSSSPEFRVEVTGKGKCRFLKGTGEVEFDLDTSKGDYATTFAPGSATAKLIRNSVVRADIAHARRWVIVVQMPHAPSDKHHDRMTFTMTGDLLTAEMDHAAAANGPYLPQEVTVHRRVAN